MKATLAALLSLALVAGCLVISSGAGARSWPRILAGVAAIGAALIAGDFILLP